MLEPGTKIQIKSAAEIDKTLNANKCCKKVVFVDDMYCYCGNYYHIDIYNPKNNTYRVKETDLNLWSWCPEWFEVITYPSKYFNDGSIEERSLCLALCRQALSENPVNLEIFTKSSCLECPSKINGGFNYCDFSKDDWYDRIAENIPDWPCLRLKPQILEKALQYLLEYRGPSKIQDYISGLVETWFNWDRTSEGVDYWRTVCSTTPENAKFKQPELVSVKTTINKTNYENRFQKRKAVVIRGSVPEGNKVCSRKCETTVVCGHIDYRVIIGR